MAVANQRKLDRALWTGQWTLAASFQVLGMLKLCLSAEELGALGLGSAAAAPARLLHAVGAAELALALAAVLPAATRILPRLSTASAAALAAAAALGAVLPTAAAASGSAAADLALAALAGLVAWGRAVKVPIAPLAIEAEDAAAAALVRAQLERARARAGAGVAGRFGRLGQRLPPPRAQQAAPADEGTRRRVLAIRPLPSRQVVLVGGR